MLKLSAVAVTYTLQILGTLPSTFADKQEIQSRDLFWKLEFNSGCQIQARFPLQPVLLPVSAECEPAPLDTSKLPQMLSWLPLSVDKTSLKR